jgi:hypothetical protein
VRFLRAAALATLMGCSAPQATPAPSSSRASAPSASAPAAAASASAPEGEARAAKPAIGYQEAEETLFLGRPTASAKACRERDDPPQAIRCLLQVAYEGDASARALALALYEEAGIVSGIEPRQTMDGGWRGMLELVPELPHRRHLDWLLPAYRDYTSFFAALAEHASAPIAYRHQPILLRFFRSVGRTTPSAYASGWTVAYNVSGSLHTSADAVRETMFHETFHLNDSDHGRWSQKALTPLYEAVLDRCTRAGKLVTSCLTPYAPNDTMVRGGTYYAFQPGNGVWEYAAELAIRYYDEHRRVFAGKKLTQKAFKCGPAPNAEAWKLLADEFFGGVDRVPPC